MWVVDFRAGFEETRSERAKAGRGGQKKNAKSYEKASPRGKKCEVKGAVKNIMKRLSQRDRKKRAQENHV